MASTVARAYNVGLGAEPTTSTWPYEAESFSVFWASNVSSKICFNRLTVAESINHSHV